MHSATNPLTLYEIDEAFFDWMQRGIKPEPAIWAAPKVHHIGRLSMDNLMDKISSFICPNFTTTAAGLDLEGLIHWKALQLGDEHLSAPQNTRLHLKSKALAEYFYYTSYGSNASKRLER
jgi:hypothetical protein